MPALIDLRKKRCLCNLCEQPKKAKCSRTIKDIVDSDPSLPTSFVLVPAREFKTLTKRSGICRSTHFSVSSRGVRYFSTIVTKQAGKLDLSLRLEIRKQNIFDAAHL